MEKWSHFTKTVTHSASVRIVLIHPLYRSIDQSWKMQGSYHGLWGQKKWVGRKPWDLPCSYPNPNTSPHRHWLSNFHTTLIVCSHKTSLIFTKCSDKKSLADPNKAGIRNLGWWWSKRVLLDYDVTDKRNYWRGNWKRWQICVAIWAK